MKNNKRNINDEMNDQDCEEDGDENDNELYLIRDNTEVDYFRRWLKMVTRWTCALRAIGSEGGVGRLLRTRSFQLWLISVGLIGHPPLLPFQDVVASIAQLISPGHAMYIAANGKGCTTKIKQALTDRAFKNKRKTLLENWSFPDKVHCESMLTSHICDKVNTSQSVGSKHDHKYGLQRIGMTRRYCYLCHLYLDMKDIEHTGSHGRIMPWIPPPAITAGEVQQLLSDLQRRSVSFLDTAGQHCRTDSRDSVISKSSLGTEDATQYDENQTSEVLEEFQQAAAKLRIKPTVKVKAEPQ
jgi:hypothetical protein